MKKIDLPCAGLRRPANVIVLLMLAATAAASVAFSAIAEDLTFTPLAGMTVSSFDGQGSAARFLQPTDLTVDSTGNIYVADWQDAVIRKISFSGRVTTLAGASGRSGHVDGAGSSARFGAPSGVAVSADGYVYVADPGYSTIRKITPAGVVTTFAGMPGVPGTVDGTGTSARFDSPTGVALDQAGNLYVADQSNETIRKITPGGVVTTLAGLAGAYGSADGTGSSARFNTPSDVIVDAGDNVYVADSGNYTIRKITPAGVVTTFAGLAGSSGSVDASGGNARFRWPTGLSIFEGTIYVSDLTNHTIRKISAAGVVTTLAGLALTPGLANGSGGAARFYYPSDVAVDIIGNAYVADNVNRTVRKISPAGSVTTLAGSGYWTATADGQGAAARFYIPTSVEIDTDGTIYVADYYNHAIRKVSVSGAVTTFAGKVDESGHVDGPGIFARFRAPNGLAIDASHNVYVSESWGNTIRMITPAGYVTTIAGSPGAQGSADGTGGAARFMEPAELAYDGSLYIYVADRGNHTIRRIAPGGVVTTLAGVAGSAGSADGTGNAARFNHPSGLAIDLDGNLIVSDGSNFTIRKVTPAGVVTTIAGSPGIAGSSDGAGNVARFRDLAGLDVDASGGILIVDMGGRTIRKMSTSGDVTTVASLGYTSTSDSAPRVSREGTGSHAKFAMPTDVAVDAAGRLYVLDGDSDVLLRGESALPGSLSAVSTPGFISVLHQLHFSGAASSYLWRITRAPAGSTAQLSSAAAAAPTFMPDRKELYEFQLTATNGASTFIGYFELRPPSVAASAPAILENGGSATITFTLSEAFTEAASFDWTTADATAQAGHDYVAASGTITFAPGETIKTTTIQILDDTVDEFDEYFNVNFAESTKAIGYSGTVLIQGSEDTPPTISIADAAVAEGNSGNKSLDFTVTLSGPSGRQIMASYNTVWSGTATPGFDYISTSGSVTFLAGETAKTVAVQVKADTQPEQNELFELSLSTISNATAGDLTANGTIIDDDAVTTPTGLHATATTSTSVAVSWNAVPNAVGYELHRDDEELGNQFVETVVGTTFTDSTVEAGRAYIYNVAAQDSAGMSSALSFPELATTVIFTDPTLTPGVTAIKAAHISELRTAVNAVRQLARLEPAVFTDPTLVAGVTPPRSVHLTELRIALNAARVALWLPAVECNEPTISEGVTPVRALHFEELRFGVR